MRKRCERCVCKMCGSSLEIRVIIYNKFGGEGMEMYCPNCKRIEYGTEPEIYQLAKEFVENVEFDYFPEMEEGMRNFQLNIAKVCEMLAWSLRKMEMLDEFGVKDEHKSRLKIN